MIKVGRPERYVKRSLGMAIRTKDWEQIQRAHSEHAAKVVDHSHHLESHQSPEQYVAMLAEEPEYPTHLIERGHGTSPKMIHQVPIGDDPEQVQKIMTKPYHNKIEANHRSWVKNPIRGWATMTTKALYVAAGIGQLAEDVSVHEHQGIPVTVHTFARGYDTVYDLQDEVARFDSPIRRYPNPLQIYQIAVMDFLTGNVDRHGFNLMVSSNPDPDQHHPLLAIDHENAFQYSKSLAEMIGTDDPYMPERNIGGRTADKPYDYLHLSNALHQAHRAGYDNGWEDFHAWWVESADAIRAEFEKQLAHIRDDRIKEHLLQNFNIRLSIIQRWAGEDDEANHQEMDLFDKEFPYEARNTEMELASVEETDSILNALPADPVKSIMMIASVFENVGVQVKQKLLATFNRLMESIGPEQLVSLYDKARKDPGKKIEHNPLSTALLFKVLQVGDETLADALLDYENQGKPGKIPLAFKQKLRQV